MTRLKFFMITGLVFAGLMAVTVRLYGLQIADREKVLLTPYQDRKTLALMNDLLREGILSQDGQGRVKLDAGKLKPRVTSPVLRQRIQRLASAARLHPGARSFDPRLLSVLSPQRRLVEPLVLRGSLLDHNGEALAYSRISNKGRSQTRVYPLGPITQQVLGFHHPVFGNEGLEAIADGYLSNPDPRKNTLTLSPGLKGLKQGKDINLTLDAALQKAAYQALDGQRGAVVVLDVATGAIRVAVGSPAFDPNTKELNQWRRARNQNRGLLFMSRAWSVLLPPGSTFKLVVAAAHLEASLPEPRILCQGIDRNLSISDLRAHGRVDLDHALIRSCNIYFARLGVKLGPAVPAMASQLGFNRTLDLIPQSTEWNLPAEASLAYAHYQFVSLSRELGSRVIRSLVPFQSFRRDKKIAAQCAIGQNQVAATPLQMAMVAQAVANDGVLRWPYLVAGLGDPNDPITYEPWAPPPGEMVMSQATAARLQTIMAKVMTQGTGRSVPKIMVDGQELPMAGKTGTAETGMPGQSPHAWFVGFAPAERPQLAIAVVVENGGLGGKVAAPLASRILQTALAAQASDQGLASMDHRQRMTP